MSSFDDADRDEWARFPSVRIGRVPLTTRLALLFGGFFLNFGAAFFAFGMTFIWLFGATSNLSAPKFWFAETATATSEVFDEFSTNASENERDIRGYRYSFETPDGRRYQGEAYSSTVAPHGDVEYLVSDPATNRMVAFRNSTFPSWALLLIGIFPATGAAMMLFGYRGNRRRLRALSNSRLARGKLSSKEATGTRINDQTVYKYTFEFTDEYGVPRVAVAKTHQGQRIEDEGEERILYSTLDPENSVLVDDLPGRPEVRDDGTLGGVSPLGVLLRMILPVGGVLVHALIGFRVLFPAEQL